MPEQICNYSGFIGHRLIHRGAIEEVVRGAKSLIDDGQTDRIAIFDDTTCRPIDIDYRGSPDEVVARLADHPMLSNAGTEAETAPRRGPGRPKLGVVAGEVTLLPRHWSWLKTQRGGASATLRRLVEDARRQGQQSDRARHAEEAIHRFLWDMASDLPGFEEASRVFFARDYPAFIERMVDWPADIRAHVVYLLEGSLTRPT